MAHTVIGIFENESDGQQAQNYLLDNGFADGDVDIKTASYKSHTTEASDRHTTAEDNDILAKIGSFFKDLFGENEHEAKLYSEAGKHGTIVTVHALTSAEADAAADVLDQFGAVNVKENAARHSASPIFTDGAFSGEGIPSDAHRLDASDPNTHDTYTRNSPADPLPTSDQQLRSDRQETQEPILRHRSRIFERTLQDHIRLRQQTQSHNPTPLSTSSNDPDLQTYRDLDQTVADSDQKTDNDLPTRTGNQQLSDEERLRRLNLGL